MKKKRRSNSATEQRRGPAAATPDRYTLYERCAQNPARDVRMLRAMHAGDPVILGEDFSAAGALSLAWVRSSRSSRAVAVDHDREPLSRLPRHPRIRAVCDDVMRADDPADIIAVLNFSICEFHARRALVRYLRHARRRLRDGGVLITDVYAGADSFVTGAVAQRVVMPDGTRVRYEWEQRHADPLTGRVVNAMHFTCTAPDGRRERLRDAFVYDWRLWSVPELRDAMTEAGFPLTEVYPRFAGATDAEGNLYVQPIRDPFELDDSFSVYVVGRA